MKTILVLAAAAAALAGAAIAAPAASAAPRGVCANGYMTIDTDVIVRCDGGPMAYHAAVRPTRALRDTPEYTGALAYNRHAAKAPESLIVGSPQACRPGQYWMMRGSSGDMPNRIMSCG